ncbi:phytoene desaturase family protein [Tomitella gaofuii]|uniref:phytoene desaturase family protein n=1 Tax=Tomitella gaofuii TaxID=2760083 RepID=UPI0015FBF686|nr:phytoene desaturase family protein [Tomitella gaofuii]
MRTVTGPSSRVVIIGAGLSGLCAAMHLLGAGRQVTVLERDAEPGGRMGVLDGPGYRADSGATVLTMPELIDDALAAVGMTRTDTSPVLRLTRLAPAYRARFADGTAFDVHSDPDEMTAEIARVFGDAEVEGYLRLRSWLERMFAAEFDRFLDASFDSPLDLVGSPGALADLARVTALGGFGRLGPRVARFIRDPRLRRVFTFQALYAGLAPRKALAVYGAIPHMDTSLGVYFPAGGMHAVTKALADAVVRAGGTIEYCAQARSVDIADGRAQAVLTSDGRIHDCDALVLTPDLPVVDALLASAGTPRHHTLAGGRLRRTQWSPSAVVLHGTIPRDTARAGSAWDRPHHHTIDFGDAWDETFAQICARPGRGSLMTDPSLLLTRPGLTDPGLDPQSSTGPRELLSVLAPCPNLHSAPLPWDELGPSYADDILSVLEQRGYIGISDPDRGLRVDRLFTPATWAAQGMGAGSPFSAAHTFRQTGPFRRPNLVRGLDNTVLAGCGTTPGVGVPTALISGRLAAERITGGCARHRGRPQGGVADRSGTVGRSRPSAPAIAPGGTQGADQR